MAQHFQRECEHHSVRCPKCSAIVLCKDVCRHLKSTSCNTSTPLAPESRNPPRHTDKTVSVSSLKGAFESQAGGIIACMRPTAADISSHDDRLKEISQDINTLKKTLRQELASLTRQNRDIVKKSVLEIASSNSELKESFATCSNTANACLRTITKLEKTLSDKSRGTRHDLSQAPTGMRHSNAKKKSSIQKTFQTGSSALKRSVLEVRECEFFVKVVGSLENTTMQKGWAEYENEKVYLRGYCMSLGIYLEKSGQSVTLQAMYTLRKGEMDDTLRWPFQHSMIMRVIHPSLGISRDLEVEPSPYDSCNQKPTALSTVSGYSSECLYLLNLTVDGYTPGDQLGIKWELQP